MSRIVRLVVSLALLSTLAFVTVTGASADARKTFSSTMTGLPTASLEVAGITGAGAAWTIGAGSATLTEGRLHIDVQGLVLTSNGTNPVDFGRGVVSCNGELAATTDTVPFSDQGNATVNAEVSLPSPCLAPAVFFTNTSGRWFAVTGF